MGKQDKMVGGDSGQGLWDIKETVHDIFFQTQSQVSFSHLK